MNIIYARFSPKPKGAIERSSTIDVQIDACSRYCSNQGFLVDRIVTDAEVSARKTALFTRDGGRVLKDLSPGDRIIVMRLDRIFRDTVDGLTSIDLFNRQQIELHLADQGGNSINVGTATGKFIATTLLGIAAFEPEITAERTSQSHKHKMRNGGNFLPDCRIPYGKMADPESPVNVNGVHSRTLPCPEELEIIEEALQLSETLRMQELTADLNLRGLLNRGKPWHHNTLKRILNRARRERNEQPREGGTGRTGSCRSPEDPSWD